MKNWEVWIEGYSCTGQCGKHQYLGSVEAETFKEACSIAIMRWLMRDRTKEEAIRDYKDFYNEDRCSYWGCRCFDNATDAAKSFG